MMPRPDCPSLQVPCRLCPRLQEHTSASHQMDVAAWQEERLVSKFAADLPQLPCTRPIPMDPKEVGSHPCCHSCPAAAAATLLLLLLLLQPCCPCCQRCSPSC